MKILDRFKMLDSGVPVPLKIKGTAVLLWELVKTFIDNHWGVILIVEMVVLFLALGGLNWICFHK